MHICLYNNLCSISNNNINLTCLLACCLLQIAVDKVWDFKHAGLFIIYIFIVFDGYKIHMLSFHSEH